MCQTGVIRKGGPGSNQRRDALMADIGGAADKAKDYAKDNPEKVDQGKEKAKDAFDGQKDGDQK